MYEFRLRFHWALFLMVKLFVKGIHQSLVDVSLMLTKTNGSTNSRVADDMRCHSGLCDISVMVLQPVLKLNDRHCFYTPRTTKLLGGYTGFTPSVRLLGGWHFIAATAIKPPKAACQFAADDILLYKFAIISNGFTSPFGKKEKKNCQLYNTILSLYISYQDITRRVC